MFRRKRSAEPPGAAPGVGLRAMALSLDPTEIDLASDSPLFGVVMDTGMPDGGWFCVVVLADGTASLYTGGTFGVIGAGAHEAVRQTGRRLLDAVDERLGLFHPDLDDSTPEPGQVTIRALTAAGRQRLDASEAELGSGGHPASGLFYAAHEVITAIRESTPAQ